MVDDWRVLDLLAFRDRAEAVALTVDDKFPGEQFRTGNRGAAAAKIGASFSQGEIAVNPFVLLSSQNQRGGAVLRDQLPTLAAGLYFMVLLWSGAPSRAPEFASISRSASNLNASAAVVLVLALFVASVALSPIVDLLASMQQGLSIPRGVERRLRYRFVRAREEMAFGSSTIENFSLSYPSGPDEVRATRLGNIVRAAESSAGEMWGFDTVLMLPRLMQILPPRSAALVEEAIEAVRLPSRLCAAFTLSSLLSIPLLARWGWWNIALLIPVGLSALFYLAAISAAREFGSTLQSAFDMHHGLLDSAFEAKPIELYDELVNWRRDTCLALWVRTTNLLPRPQEDNERTHETVHGYL